MILRFLFVMSAVLLFVLYNPEFGVQARAWFWEALQGKGSVYAYDWNPSLLQAGEKEVMRFDAPSEPG